MNLATNAHAVVSRPLQTRFLSIPQTPICYWLRERFFDLLAGKTLGDAAEIPEGLGTRDDARFVRFTWEVLPGNWAISFHSRRWIPFEKGGGYGKWFGHQFWVVDWAYGGARIKAFPASVVRNEQHYFKEGWTYSHVARGSLGFRILNGGTIISDKSSGVIPRSKQKDLGVLLNCRQSSFAARAMAQSLDIRESYIARLPLPKSHPPSLDAIEAACVALKRDLIANDLLERTFVNMPGDVEAITAILHTLEGISEGIVFDAYCIGGDDLQAILDETGTPAGWHSLIKGFDALPQLPEGLPEIPDEVLSYLTQLGISEMPFVSISKDRLGFENRVGLPLVNGILESCKSLNTHERRASDGTELTALRSRLRALYEAGPGAKEETTDTEGDATDDDDEDNEQIVVGARIPIPAETFLEELSQKIEIHPISVYWLLKEGIERDGWRCLPEEQRRTKGKFTVLILRLLGHRWPNQMEAGEPIPEWADENGIIPLMEGLEEVSLYQRLRERLAADQGDQQVSTEENRFAGTMGKTLNDWAKKDFFRHHLSQFRKRPLVWHLTSARWTSRKGQEPACEFFIYYHKMDGDFLPKLISHYIGPLKKRFELELHGLESRSEKDLTAEQASRKELLRNRIGELGVFNKTIAEVITSGFGPAGLKDHTLRQYAIDDAMLCLKARWLKKLSTFLQARPLDEWLKKADQTELHTDFSTWIADTMTHLDYHCAVVGPRPPDEKTLSSDPAAADLAGLISADAEIMLENVLKYACNIWWKPFNAHILKPLSDQIRDGKKRVQILKEMADDPQRSFKEQAEITREIKGIKDNIRMLQTELFQKTGLGQEIKDAILSWQCPEVLTWGPWLADQQMYDQVSSLNEKRPPPKTVADFIQQESLYQLDINDGVRVNIAPLQKAGLLFMDVLATKDVDKAIADRADWRAD